MLPKKASLLKSSLVWMMMAKPKLPLLFLLLPFIPQAGLWLKKPCKPRIVNDGTACGINDCCHYPKHHMRNLLQLIRMMRRGCVYNIADLVDAYWGLWAKNRYRRRFGIYVPAVDGLPELYYLWNVLWFGYAAATTLMGEVTFELLNATLVDLDDIRLFVERCVCLYFPSSHVAFLGG